MKLVFIDVKYNGEVKLTKECLEISREEQY